MIAALGAALVPYADPTPATTPDPAVPDLVTTGSWTPGLLSLAAFVFLALAIWIIYRSMNTRLKKVDFPEQPVPPRPGRPPRAEPGPPAG